MCSENVDVVLHAEEEPFSVNVRVFELTLLNKQALYEKKKNVKTSGRRINCMDSRKRKRPAREIEHIKELFKSV